MRKLCLCLPLACLLACDDVTTGPGAVQPVITWTARASGTTNNLRSVTWTGTQLVAVGDLGTILTSSDGATWTMRSSPVTNSSTSNLLSVIWTGSQIVTVGTFGTILTSPDGITWTLQTSNIIDNPVSHLYSVTWTGSQLVAVGTFGTVVTSPDGVTWKEQYNITPQHLRAVINAGAQIVTAGIGVTGTSSDGSAWTVKKLEPATDTLYSVTWTGTQFVAVGGNGTNSSPILVSPNAVILTSADGVNWTPQDSKMTNNPAASLMSVAWMRIGLAAVGQNGAVLVSPDGVNWTAQQVGTVNFSSVTQAGDQWVIVGDNGTIQTAPVDASFFHLAVPGAPTNVAALAGNGQAAVSWIAPASNGGSEITGYTATAVQDTGKHCATATLSCVVTGLANGTAYTFTVTAANAKGKGTASAPSPRVVPTTTAPDAPTNAAALAGNGQAVVSWIAPASNGGSEITGYTATAVQDSSKHCATATLSCVVTGLANGTAYTFTVTAANAKGKGTASAPSSPVTPATPPSSPTNVKGTADYAQAIVSWIAPASNGGSEITGFTATAVQDSSKHCATATLSCVVTGLANGTAYTFTVTASNAVATSPASQSSSPVTPMIFPGVLWTSQNSGTLNFLNGAVWAGTQWIVVGASGTILTSPDGIVWTARSSHTILNLNSVIWTGTKVIAVGDSGMVLSSVDGVTWTSGNSGTPTNLSSVVWTGTKLVAVGGDILTSPDGVSWTPQYSTNSNPLHSVVWTGNQLVAVSFSGNIVTSPDGVAWTSQNPGVTDILSSAAWTGSNLIVVGGTDTTSGAVLISPNGINWTRQSPETNYALSSVGWSGTHLAATSFYGNMLTSPDGLLWTPRNSGTSSQLNSIAWSAADSTWMAVGAHGAILTSH